MGCKQLTSHTTQEYTRALTRIRMKFYSHIRLEGYYKKSRNLLLQIGYTTCCFLDTYFPYDFRTKYVG